MGFITQDATGVLDGATARSGGNKSFTLTDLNDQTNLVPFEAGETGLIHINMTGACTVEILCYVKPGGTGIPLSFDGALTFTADTCLGFTAPGKCFISVNMTVDGGSTVVTITK